MNKAAKFTERLALAVARRFYDYGFDDIRDKEVRAYLNSARALVESAVPLASWQKERNRTVDKRFKKLSRTPAIQLSEAELDEYVELQNYRDECGDVERKKRLRVTEARANEPRLAEQFDLESGKKKQRTK